MLDIHFALAAIRIVGATARQVLLAVSVVAFFLGAPAVAGPFEEGVAAYQRGDYATALWLWRPLAEQGNAYAQSALGFMYDNGVGVRQDYTEAVRWYRKAADQGEAIAQNNLGVMYEGGRGVLQDAVEAVRWYRRAADRGVALAQNNLGIMYDNGRGVLQDYVEAVRWYSRAADQGNAGAQYNLGHMYAKGRGVPQDFVKAHKWFNLASSGFPPGSDRENAVNSRNILAHAMTPTQIAEAQRSAREWRPRAETAAAAATAPRLYSDAEVFGTPPTLVAEAQRLLGQLGYNFGSADGVAGSRTRAAVRAYQTASGMTPDGEIDETLVARLRRDSAARSTARAAAPAPATPREPTVAISGTGFYVTRDGHLMTNAHVVAGCKAIRARGADGDTIDARVLATAASDDLAVLKVDRKPAQVATFRIGAPLRQGEGIIVYGFPLTGLLASSGNLTAGNLTALAGPRDDARLMQISAPVQPGSSGGPVLDRASNIVGVVVGKLDALLVASVLKDIPQNVNFAIKGSVAINLLEARGVAYVTATPASEMTDAAIADRARAFTVRVDCLQ